MKLLELLNSTVPHKVATEASDSYEEEAIINGRKIVFSATTDYHEQKDWEVAFFEMKKGRQFVKQTGSGGELQVFSFVFDALRRFIYGYDPKAFHFSADNKEPSRVKLYTAFAKRIKYDNYEHTMETLHGSTYWLYKRTD